VKEAIQDAFKAGIEVIMITGDHPATAYTIAEELGIASSFDEVINGYDLTKIEDFEEKKRIVLNKKVFARISPEQKKELVSIFEDAGHFIAVTGDGVNDAPALKYANVGVSMGKSGTDVARESSDVVITDDHFQSIVNGIEEGRIAYDNIRKIIFLLISTGAAEIMLVTFSVVFNTPMSLTPLQILWLNLVTNGVQDVALALEKGEPGVLERKPRSPDEGIFNSIMIRRVLISGLYMGFVAFGAFYFFYSSGYSVFESRNYALLLMVLFENVHVFNSRSETLQIWKIKVFENKFLIPMVLFAQLVHIASMHIPVMQEVLDVQPVDINTWIVLLLIAAGLLVLMEFDKWLARAVKRNGLLKQT
jgi:magnesium-transporting ATPase (P-type)